MVGKIEAQVVKVEKAQVALDKKVATLGKKQDRLAKLQAKFDAMPGELFVDGVATEKQFLKWDIGGLEDDVERLKSEIQDRERILAEAQERLAEVQAQEQEFERLYGILKDFCDSTVEAWDRFDISARDHRLAIRDEVYDRMDALRPRVTELSDQARSERRIRGYEFDRLDAFMREVDPEFFREYLEVREQYEDIRANMEADRRTDAQIHEENVQAVKSLVIDLYARVGKIVGEANDWSGIHVTQGNGGFAVLNGRVDGSRGCASVKSILAGGYNIQRLHIRTLVHAI